ncbi:MAG: patatin-like phospholipase family protein [Candidatus Obscuribacterales bacterium]|jgi:hypothetical protein
MDQDWKHWGPLAERYQKPGPRKMLALDGGGMRGVITLEILLALEQKLAAQSGRGEEFCLAEFFDYIGGTSTGAIIATGLARGMKVAELQDFYFRCGENMFDRARLFDMYKQLYKKEPLIEELHKVYGAESTMQPEHLETLLLVVMKNVTTDSPWPISSNPWAKYNEPNRADQNSRIPLWKIVRASTAAPVFFPPEVIEWDPNNHDKTFVFVDGGVTPFNNPAFQMYKMATIPEYRLGWPTGEKNLLIVSVGTGIAPSDEVIKSPEISIAHTIKTLPPDLMFAIQVEQDVNCRTIGRCSYGVEIDRELGDMIPRNNGVPISLNEDTGKQFLYVRYNADISKKHLAELAIEGKNAKHVKDIDKASAIPDLRTVGQDAAKSVSLDHLGSFSKHWSTVRGIRS